ncbi:hypothetical protein Mgra_00009967 [Meloidogyne graminicola]|uniref:HTH araC/xylS-type domain-containing protein n=1 Tax=Meloidogyne graminicola TaxID=189291 RepID=A0A8S9ZCU6_9BILA|nr:hypothetical protein Mgra_00009967 [Meloidogyne graminicola]
MSIFSNSFTLSSVTMTSTGSDISETLNDNNRIDKALKLLTGRLNQFRDHISQTLLSTPQGYSSLGSFIEDFSYCYGYNPSERARSFGYFSLFEFLKSDYMKGRVWFKVFLNGDLHLLPRVDENTEVLFKQILISYEQRRNKRYNRLRRSIKHRYFY